MLDGMMAQAGSAEDRAGFQDLTTGEIFGLASQRTPSGERVTPDTAVSNTTIFGAIQLISRAVGMLPADVIERTSDGGRREKPEHPVARIFDLEPNREMTPQVFREQMSARPFLWGAAHALIDRQGNRPVGLIPFAPGSVSMGRLEDGDPIFFHRHPEFGIRPIRQEDMFHVPGVVSWGIAGRPNIECSKEAVGLGLAAQRMGGSFFGQGGVPGGVLQHPGKLKPETVAKLQNEWEKRHRGADKAWKIAVLQEGMEWAQTEMEPDKAQVLETRKFQVTEGARIFNCPPHLLGDLEHATFSNIEHQQIEFVTYTLGWIVLRFEQEARRKLFSRTEQPTHKLKLNTNALLRGDTAARAAFYAKLWEIGAMSRREIRDREDLPRRPGDDRFFVPKNFSVLGDDGRPEEAPSSPSPPPPGDEDDTSGAAARSVAKEWLRDGLSRVMARHTDRVRSAVRRVESGVKLNAWWEKHYEDHVAHAVRTLESPLSTLVGSDDAADTVRSVFGSWNKADLGDAIHAVVGPEGSRDAFLGQLPEWRSERTEEILAGLLGELEDE